MSETDGISHFVSVAEINRERAREHRNQRGKEKRERASESPRHIHVEVFLDMCRLFKKVHDTSPISEHCYVEWVCRLWAVCQGKVRVPILYPDLSALLLHVFCQCCAAQRNPEIRVLIAVIAAQPCIYL